MAKGGSFEREVSEEFSLWFTQGERDDIFGRSDGSGGRFTSRRKSGKDTANQAGDLTFTDSIGEPLIKACNIECKTGYGKKKRVKDKSSGETLGSFQKQWDILDFIDSKKTKFKFEEMWIQCKRDSELSGRTPLLVFRRNLRSKCIVLNEDFYHRLEDYFGAFYSPFFIFKKQEEKIYIMALKDFFDWTHNIRAFLSQD